MRSLFSSPCEHLEFTRLSQIYEWATSRILFPFDVETLDPQNQLYKMVQVLGDFPPSLIASGKHASKYFMPDGQSLCLWYSHITLSSLLPGKLKVGPTQDERLSLDKSIYYNLMKATGKPDHGNLDGEDVGLFMAFLGVMVCLNPDDRTSAWDLIKHPWLLETLTQLYEGMEKTEAAAAATAASANLSS